MSKEGSIEVKRPVAYNGMVVVHTLQRSIQAQGGGGAIPNCSIMVQMLVDEPRALCEREEAQCVWMFRGMSRYEMRVREGETREEEGIA
jgi:hypothetical protein